MRVLFSTTGGSGHFGPLLPFARALVDSGHEVTVTAPASLASVVVRAGFTCQPRTDIAPDALGRFFAGMGDMSLEERNLLYIREVFGRLNLEYGLEDAKRIAAEWRPDLVVREAAEITSLAAANLLQIPQVQVSTGLASLDGVFFPQVAIALAEAGLADAAALVNALPRLTAVPPSFDVPASQSGRIFRYRTEDGHQPSEPLPDWWPGKADPLVYVTFGSEAGGMDLFPGFYRAVIDLLARLRIRVLLTVGDRADPGRLGELPANVHVEKFWPQSAAMPFAAAMVGHGGYGTTLTALAAGVPTVAIPLFALDQHQNARRVNEVGAGIALAGGPADLGQLAQALESLLSEASYAAAAGCIAAEIAALPPASESVAVFEQVASG